MFLHRMNGSGTRNKRRAIAFALSGGLGILLLIWCLMQRKEPVYQGKTVSQWIEEGADQVWFQGTNLCSFAMLGDPVAVADYLAPLPAFSAIRALGAQAVPGLKRVLNAQPSSDVDRGWKSRAYVRIYSWPYLPSLIRSVLPRPRFSSRTQEFAACALIAAEVLSLEEQIDLFVSLYRHPDPGLHPIAALMLKRKALSSERIELFLRKLCWDNRDYKEVLYLNDQLHVEGTNLVKYFVPLLKTPATGLRQKTVGTLQQMGPNAAPALKDLMITATNDWDEDIRYLAVEAIGAIGPAAKEAVPLLLELTGAEQRRMRAAARKALQQIDPEAAPPEESK